MLPREVFLFDCLQAYECAAVCWRETTLRIYDLRTLAIYDANPAMRQLNTQSFYCFRLTVSSDIPLENDGKIYDTHSVAKSACLESLVVK